MTRNEELEAAYRNTDYWVDDAPDEPFAIRVDEDCLELAVLLAAANEFEWAFITACNPGSQRLPDDENAQQMRVLEASVEAGGWRYYHGHGAGRDGEWQPEPSLLILGISKKQAVQLARRFGQNAIVVGSLGEPAKLIWSAAM